MLNLKKLVFAPLFLLCFGSLIFYLSGFFKSSPFTFFSFTFETAIPFIVITTLTLLSAFLLAVFITLAQDWKIISPVLVLGSLLPFAFLPSPLNIYLGLGSVISLFIESAVIMDKLKKYLTFQPSTLLSSSIKNLATLLVLTISICYFVSIDAQIKENGIKIPDSVIDSITNLTPQIADIPQSLAGTLKETIRTQIEAMIKPYENFIAPVFGLLIFSTLLSFIWLLGFFVPLLLFLIFWVLTKTGFVKFVTEMREVKKLIV